MIDREKPRVLIVNDDGIDAPGIVRMMFMLGSGSLVAALVLAFIPWLGDPWGGIIVGVLLVTAANLLGMGCLMVYGSKIGKVKRPLSGA